MHIFFDYASLKYWQQKYTKYGSYSCALYNKLNSKGFIWCSVLEILWSSVILQHVRQHPGQAKGSLLSLEPRIIFHTSPPSLGFSLLIAISVQILLFEDEAVDDGAVNNVKTAESGIKKVCHHIIPHLKKARLYKRKKISS